MSANIHADCADKTSSVYLAAGWSVKLFRDQNQSGSSICFNRSDENLDNNTYSDNSAMDNTISSFTLYNQSWCGGSPTPAYPLEVYNDANYSGSWCYSHTSMTANIASSCNDLVSSILLRSGWSIRVYRDVNQGGPSRCLNGSDSNLTDNTFSDGSPMNDAISSFILYSQSNCGGPDTTPPGGRVVSPADGVSIGPGTVSFTAEAWDNTGGSGVARVDFWIKYDGSWHKVGSDSTAPYGYSWGTPAGLHSQRIIFTIHVFDYAGNEAVDPGGYHYVSFVESADPGVDENWVPANKRAYLNQRSLSNGDVKCGATSMAMALAMNSIIGSDYNTMAAKANEMYPHTLLNGVPYVYKMVNELRRQGATSDYLYLSTSNAWNLIKQEVNAGRPVIVRTSGGIMTEAGHIIVAVGYREDGSSHKIITYDPFGKWLGSCCSNNYDRNTTSPSSAKGRWVFYNFDTVFYDPYSGNNNYLITVRNPHAAVLANTLEAPDTPPDEVNDEPENIGTYEGAESEGEIRIYLPLMFSK
ncbi:MAG: C39 family peptidase [Anaerolineae bacterium]|nr:C39 family peptidase [Anaerolineae bacterium]